ncbi:MAG: PRTRC system protein E [Vulcanimicrobiaceae bacterium]
MSTLFSQLVSTIKTGEALQLVIARLTDENILVTIQPPHSGKGTIDALPLQLRGTAGELDAEFDEQIAVYTQSRVFTLATVDEVAKEQKGLADAKLAESKAARAKGPKSSASATGTLTVTVTPEPENLTIHAKPANGDAKALESGEETTLPNGPYTITVKADDFEEKSESVMVTSVKPIELSITLVEAQPALF